MDLLNDTSWGCWVWTIGGVWGGILVLSCPWMMWGITLLLITKFVSWSMVSTKTYLLSITSYSLKTSLCFLPFQTQLSQWIFHFCLKEGSYSGIVKLTLTRAFNLTNIVVTISLSLPYLNVPYKALLWLDIPKCACA